MGRQEILELMDKAGFNTEWSDYVMLRETIQKYERFARLVENRVVAQLAPCGQEYEQLEMQGRQ